MLCQLAGPGCMEAVQALQRAPRQPRPCPAPPCLCRLQVGLQTAMLIVPLCYLLSGVGLAITEGVIKAERAKGVALHQHAHAAATTAAAPDNPS